jgi:hypothetical protein
LYCIFPKIEIIEQCPLRNIPAFALSEGRQIGFVVVYAQFSDNHRDDWFRNLLFDWSGISVLCHFITEKHPETSQKLANHPDSPSVIGDNCFGVLFGG